MTHKTLQQMKTARLAAMSADDRAGLVRRRLLGSKQAVDADDASACG